MQAKKYSSTKLPFLSKGRKIFAIVGGMVVIVVVAIGALAGQNLHNTCDALSRNGIETTATVKTLGVSFKDGQRSRAPYRDTDDLSIATRLISDISYVVDGTTYEDQIYFFGYHDHQPHVAELYNEAKYDTMKVRYLPDDPKTVRPSVQFSGTVVRSCGG